MSARVFHQVPNMERNGFRSWDFFPVVQVLAGQGWQSSIAIRWFLAFCLYELSPTPTEQLLRMVVTTVRKTAPSKSCVTMSI